MPAGRAAIAIVVSTTIAIAAPPLLAQDAPAAPQVRFELRTISGETWRVGPKEAPTMVAVFATWCRSCRADIEELNRLAASLAPRVRVIAVNEDKNESDVVRRWLESHKATYTAALDTAGTVARALGVVGVPEFHLISGDGRVVFTRRGPIASALPALQRAVEQLK